MKPRCAAAHSGCVIEYKTRKERSQWKREKKKKKHIYIDLHEFSPAVQSHKDTRFKNNPHSKQNKRRYFSLNTTTKFWIENILQFLSGAKLSIMVVDNDKSFIVSGILLTHTFLHHSKFS